MKLKTKYPNLIFALFSIVILILSGQGCSITRTIKKIDGEFKKKILITSFENQTFYKNYEINTTFRKTLVEAIKKTSPDILLVVSGDEEFPENFLNLPRLASDEIDNFTLAETGRQFGINAIVTGTLRDITSNKKQKGMWWFKETRDFAQIEIVIEVYDTQTAAKLTDEVISREIEIEDSESTTISSEKNTDLPAVNNVLTEISYEIGKNIGNTIKNWPWNGYITSITGNTVVISSGEKAGLLSGDIFEVFDNEVIIKGQNGQHFSGYGHKTGEIQITKVSPESSKASLVSGEDLKIGNYIKLKP